MPQYIYRDDKKMLLKSMHRTWEEAEKLMKSAKDEGKASRIIWLGPEPPDNKEFGFFVEE